MSVGSTTFDITQDLAVSGGKGWRDMIISESCAPGLGNGFTMTSQGPMTLQIAAIERRNLPEGTPCSF